MNKKELKQLLAGLTHANIAVRNFPLTVAQLRKKLKLKDGGNTYREDDVYFTEQDGAQVPLDPDRVEDYLQAIQSLSLTDCVTYSANDDDLQSCGLDRGRLRRRGRGLRHLHAERQPRSGRAGGGGPRRRGERGGDHRLRPGGPVQAALSDYRRGVRGADGRLL